MQNYVRKLKKSEELNKNLQFKHRKIERELQNKERSWGNNKKQDWTKNYKVLNEKLQN